MVFLLLAPYNDSMRLGQGFNSFLQVPCIDNAVEIPDSAIKTQAVRAGGVDNVSQVVSYSSRFVEKISEVVRSMNISAGSSIKSGSIEVSGNSLSVDESKFAASDLNAVVSIKVINQTTQLVGDAKFLPMPDVKMNSEKFFDYYGDCFISGFMEGGDLHGIVSMKVLDASKRSEIESTLKGQLNGAAGEFTLGEGAGSSETNAALSQTETTITVNWSGGGQIKPEDEEWSLENLFRTAAAFPARVAACPQRTWAILTKYDNNRSFLEWAEKYKVKVPQFTNCQQYTSDLLDMFMEYKNNIARIQAVLSNPTAYTISPVANPVNIGVQDLIDERKKMKTEMRKIVAQIDELNMDPASLPDVEARYSIRAPEVWATRLPILKSDAAESQFSPMSTAELLSGFSFLPEPAAAHTPPSTAAPSITPVPAVALNDKVQSAMADAGRSTSTAANELSRANAMQAPPPPPLCPDDIEATLTADMRAFLASGENRRLYSSFRFDRHTGSGGGGPFNDATAIHAAMVPVAWPRRIELHMITWGDHAIVRFVKVLYDQMQLTHGSEGTTVEAKALDLSPDERVIRLKMGKGPMTWDVEGVCFVELYTSKGQIVHVGSEEEAVGVVDYYPFSGCTGLKGFHGGSGDVCDRVGPIWGS